MLATNSTGPLGADDAAEARRFMVLGQLTPNGVSDPLLLQAMGRLPRERFLPATSRHRAYADEAAPLSPGRALLQPMTLGRLIQLAMPQPGERALVLAAGTGYGAAVLADMGLIVTAVEADATLVQAGHTALEFALPGNRPELHQADPTAGWTAGAPYRLVLAEGVVPALAPALLAQLAEGGRAVMLRRRPGQVSRGVLLRRIGGSMTETESFDAAGPDLPGFGAASGFAF